VSEQKSALKQVESSPPDRRRSDVVMGGRTRGEAVWDQSETLSWVTRQAWAGRSCGQRPAGGGEGVQGDQAVEVDHDRGEAELQQGLASAPVACLAHPDVLQVVDLAFDLGATAELVGDLGVTLGSASGGHPPLVHADLDGAATGALGALLPQRAGGALRGGKAEPAARAPLGVGGRPSVAD